ncbi:cell division protein FtsL [Actinobacillus equuli subsp. equuli]|uniref:Cell division protein FtsL n=4 Tax=Actinobacillus TaxID=713 RepID=A0A0A7MG17_ACTEU|nr:MULTISPECIES: cell division protein FtsL [Actinobacillus]AFU19565.1 cell division protein FtsL [Actinobacillus suis H91-0380]AIJ31703.1 cell division protein FtsL [Actinobacillus suis ATCC 33415]AIZ79605.1 cell division protein FtsL [Actinobacillus equuli subsp. equuli]MCO4166347.1 cell division protein FtsL [Actinobacillus suis]MCO4168792.1 cell division protein FtsL [Actinobacillus suis]
MASNERYPLHQIILDDLTGHNKVALILLIATVLTAIGTIWITHQTRLLTAEQGKLVQQNRKLENQYIHLQLEENAKSQKSRVEAAAASFGLQQIKKEQEVILVE